MTPSYDERPFLRGNALRARYAQGWTVKVLAVVVAVLILWSLLIGKMYETADRQRLECLARGGQWAEPEIRPWNLVEGTCRR